MKWDVQKKYTSWFKYFKHLFRIHGQINFVPNFWYFTIKYEKYIAMSCRLKNYSFYEMGQG